ncbi:unnamed protein product [Albugo candida]|uniref:Kri1-like C-terminal domain-containing protein n=1 Tax=Albugo candida TaxID=65357 RepID=A0A024GSP8_9STRA|nr:unnamed protein product [Albugo candida]|eukprot:CCI49378.1 unnamed protein product [Albugo candida]
MALKSNRVVKNSLEGALDTPSNTAELDVKLTINKEYARKFNQVKEKQELKRLQAKLDNDSSESSDSEEEDEDGTELTGELDAAIKNTLELIRKRDPAIYDTSFQFYQDQDELPNQNKKVAIPLKDRPKYYKDVMREQLLSGELHEEDDERDTVDENKSHMTYQEEQQKLRQDFISCVQEAEKTDSSEECDVKAQELDGGLLRVRTNAEKLEKAAPMHNSEIIITDDPDEFLENYLSRQGWKEKKDTIPQYDDIIREDEADAEELEKMENYEQSYNFRFEEENAGIIQTFPRKIDGLVRREEASRKRKRQEKKERKLLERKKKEEELRRLKNLKKAQIQKKLESIARLMSKKPLEDQKAKLTESDLEAPFDPDEYDSRMQEIFNDDYYNDMEDVDQHKPKWDSSDDEVEAEVSKNDENILEEIKRRKDLCESELQDLEDDHMLNKTSSGFRYRTVQSNDFGLSVDDILEADDKDLRHLVSLKKIAPYNDREALLNRSKLKSFKKHLRQAKKEKPSLDKKSQKIKAMVDEEQAIEEEQIITDKEKCRIQDEEKREIGDEEDQQEVKNEQTIDEAPKESKKRKRRKKSSKPLKEESSIQSPKKRRKRTKQSKSMSLLSKSRLESYKLT